MVGHWRRSPLGPVTDVMWALPGGRRRLLAPTRAMADLITAVYDFDEVEVGPVEARLDGRRLDLLAPGRDLALSLEAGRGWPLPPLGPWATRWLAGPLARPLLGVRTYGVSPTGVAEWYRARWYRPVAGGWARVGGADLGPLRPLGPPDLGFGFSEPPRRPSMVWVRPLLHDPSGRLDRIVG